MLYDEVKWSEGSVCLYQYGYVMSDTEENIKVMWGDVMWCVMMNCDLYALNCIALQYCAVQCIAVHHINIHKEIRLDWIELYTVQ